MTIIGIDPGPERSACAVYQVHPVPRTPPEAFETDNPNVARFLRTASRADALVIEWPQSRGLPVGESVFRTCYWAGWFAAEFGPVVVEVTRPYIVRHFCGATHYLQDGSRKAVTKAMVKAAIYNRFGGDRQAAVGTKARPGPLYGLKGDHVYDALACALWYAETSKCPGR